ncbi:MAG: hypothetical protein KKF41_06265 [Actinobacteria bacterium]|nr:hypothetical protein [Actinomycetota bacterium]MBU2687169.1 hypothetical protein [Actinomycetota bacterium]
MECTGRSVRLMNAVDASVRRAWRSEVLNAASSSSATPPAYPGSEAGRYEWHMVGGLPRGLLVQCRITPGR